MIAYFDSSAFVPLFIEEPASGTALQLWSEADQVVSVPLLYVEARAALARARRQNRVRGDVYRPVLVRFERLHQEVVRTELGDAVIRRAGELADQRALRGYDAVHLAAAEQLADDEMLFVSADRALCEAARASGMRVSQV